MGFVLTIFSPTPPCRQTLLRLFTSSSSFSEFKRYFEPLLISQWSTLNSSNFFFVPPPLDPAPVESVVSKPKFTQNQKPTLKLHPCPRNPPENLRSPLTRLKSLSILMTSHRTSSVRASILVSPFRRGKKHCYMLDLYWVIELLLIDEQVWFFTANLLP